MAINKKIAYQDKVGVEPKTVAINQWQDDDCNEVKSVVNNNADVVDENNTLRINGDVVLQSQIDALATGTLGSLAIADVPTEDGVYIAEESGTYINAGNLVVDLSSTLTYISISGSLTTFTKIEIPISSLGYLVVDSLVKFDILISGATSGNWIIINDITLDANKTIPSGVTLHFNGGKININEFILIGTNTKIESGLIEIFDTNQEFGGTWKIKEIYPQWFGALGDGVNDDTFAIQSAIDMGIQTLISLIKIPSGTYKITNTLHLGYGSGFAHVDLIGSGLPYKGEAFGGTTIDASSFSNAPAINTQGMRRVRIEHLAIFGANKVYVETNGLGADSTALDDTLASNWYNPILDANGNSSTAPYSGICIDGYSGTSPATPYPNVSYPNWSGIVTQYNKNFSSAIKLNNVAIYGFQVGVVTQPSGSDGNGDFLNMTDTTIGYCVSAVSISHTQARNLGVNGNSNFGNCHTIFTTVTHGKKTGNIAGLIDNLSMGGNYQIFDINSSYGAIKMISCYGELMFKLGDTGVGSSNHGKNTFIGCTFKFSSINKGGRGVPKYWLEGDKAFAYFSGCSISTTELVNEIAFITEPTINVTVDNSKFECDAIVPNNTPFAILKTISRGGLILGSPINPNIDSTFKDYHPTTFGVQGFYNYSSTPTLPTGRDVLLPQNAINIPSGEQFAVLRTSIERDKFINTATWSSITISGRDISVDIGASELNRTFNGIDLGDLLFHLGTFYYVINRVGTVVTFRALSNYNDLGVINNPITAGGDAQVRHARKYALIANYYCDFTAGSATFDYYRSSDRYVGGMGGEIAVGDRLMITDEIVGVFTNFTTYPKVTAIDTTLGTITLDRTVTNSKTLVNLVWFSRTFNS